MRPQQSILPRLVDMHLEGGLDFAFSVCGYNQNEEGMIFPDDYPKRSGLFQDRLSIPAHQHSGKP
jgi:hypothetical protein